MYLYSDFVCARSTSHFEMAYFQNLEKAMNFVMEFKFSKSDVYFLNRRKKMCRWPLIISFQCRYISTIWIVTIGIGKLVTICVVEIIMIRKNLFSCCSKNNNNACLNSFLDFNHI